MKYANLIFKDGRMTLVPVQDATWPKFIDHGSIRFQYCGCQHGVAAYTEEVPVTP